MSGRLMGGLTPIFWLLLVEGVQRIDFVEGEKVRTVLTVPLLTWRQTFYLFGALGVGWCVLFALWFRNRPSEKPTVNAAELDLIQAGRHDVGTGHGNVPWMKLLKNRNLWFLCIMYFCSAYGWYFNITYLPRFLEQQGVDPKSLVGAVFKGGPLWLGAFACLAGGFLTDWYIRRTGNRKWGRRLFGVIGHGLTSLFCLALVFSTDPFYSFLAISLAAFCNDLTMGSARAVCQDIGRKYAAIVAGCMNTIGNLGGALAGWLTGEILHLALAGVDPAQEAAARRFGYQINFVTFALAYMLAVVLWTRIDPTKPVVPEES
jgi:nitrate/nitrite transporter NarK